jgi:hypothetical protein
MHLRGITESTREGGMGFRKVSIKMGFVIFTLQGKLFVIK